MFRRFLGLADPFAPYEATTPSRRLWPFLFSYIRPLRAVIIASLLLSLVSAPLEVWLIGYAGRLVDMLAGSSPARLWADHGLELVLVALLVLLIRPAV